MASHDSVGGIYKDKTKMFCLVEAAKQKVKDTGHFKKIDENRKVDNQRDVLQSLVGKYTERPAL